MAHIQDSTKLKLPAVSVQSFYGKTFKIPYQDEIRKSEHVEKTKPPHRLASLLGPTQIWQVFQKQSKALEYARTKRSGVMTFAFQQCDGIRSFLVAHPKIFWHYDIQKNPSQRCSYEIIPDSSACKMYYDLEFIIRFNESKNGPAIVDNFIFIILHFLRLMFNINNANRFDILNLDSSTDVKFSRHLIFNLSSHVFCDNRCVGEFVGFIAKKIELFLLTCDSQKVNNTSEEMCRCCQITDSFNSGCVKDVGFSREDIQELYVYDSNGKQKLICDFGVYTRNRHFRLLHNTKWRKHAPFVLSKENLYNSRFKHGVKVTDDLRLETLFLDSLISNIEYQNTYDVKVIHFRNPLNRECRLQLSSKALPSNSVHGIDAIEMPLYPEIDKFINVLVNPGQTRKHVFFSSSSVIVYDVTGYRYCQNIGRQHKSNNVKYVVNLNDYTYYQKCYDPDCSSFRSSPATLPLELKFKLEDDSVNADLMEVANVMEDLF